MIRSLITFALTGATLVGTGMLAASQWGTAGQQENSAPGEPYQTVLAMAPRGYWPADEGQGVELRDRSGNEFHGRINHVAWQSDMLDFRGRFEWLEIATPTAFAVDEYSMGGWLFVRDGNFQRQGMLFMGLWDSPKTAWRDKAAGLRIRENRTVEVFSNGQDDVLKSMAGQQAIPQAAWVHVLYTYSKGTGTLYLDGRPALSRSDVPFTSAPRSLFIGCDASWWMLHPPGSRSLDGSVRQLVFFDRVLKPDEVVRIVAGTRPDRPLISAEEVADQNGTRPSVSQLLDAVQDENMPVGQRALAALALAKMNGNAVTAVSVLVQQLSTLVEREGARLPRVEDLFRNALIKALQDIDPSRPDVRALLARTLIAPALATLDLSDPRLRKVRTLRDDGKYFEALDEYQQQRKSLPRQRFFSFGDRHRDERGDIQDRSYTALAERDGTVYKLGAGKGYEGVEAVSPAEFERAMSELAGDVPCRPHLAQTQLSQSRSRQDHQNRRAGECRVCLFGRFALHSRRVR